MKSRVTCVAPDCASEYHLTALARFVKPAVLSLMHKRRQQEDLKSVRAPPSSSVIGQANVENLVSCPFCDFCMVMENDDDHIFRCQGGNCLKESCRCVVVS